MCVAVTVITTLKGIQNFFPVIVTLLVEVCRFRQRMLQSHETCFVSFVTFLLFGSSDSCGVM